MDNAELTQLMKQVANGEQNAAFHHHFRRR